MSIHESAPSPALQDACGVAWCTYAKQQRDPGSTAQVHHDENGGIVSWLLGPAGLLRREVSFGPESVAWHVSSLEGSTSVSKDAASPFDGQHPRS